MIRFTNVHMEYPGGVDALKNINLNIEHGAMAFITGRSGAGKSTLLKLIALINRHTRGQIIVNGQNLERVRGRRITKPVPVPVPVPVHISDYDLPKDR